MSEYLPLKLQDQSESQDSVILSSNEFKGTEQFSIHNDLISTNGFRNLCPTDFLPNEYFLICNTDEDFTQVATFILLLLGAKNSESVSVTHMQLELYLLQRVFVKLANELDYSNHKPDSTIISNKIMDLVKAKLISEQKDRFKLTNEGLQVYDRLKKLAIKETTTVEKFKDLLNDLTLDELWALVYFSHPELKIEHNIYERITSKRKELALSMYYNNKLSVTKASLIAGEYVGDFIKQLKRVS